MNKLIIRWIYFWRQRRLLFTSLLVAAIALSAYSVTQLQLSTNIRETLPDNAAFTEVLKRFEGQADKTTLFLAVNSDDDVDIDLVLERIEKELAHYTAGKELPGLAQLATPSKMYERLPGLLLQADYVAMDSILANTDIDKLVSGSLRNLGTPNSWFQEIGFVEDPFGVLALGYKHLEGARALSPIEVTTSGLALENGSIVSIYQLKEASKDVDYVQLLKDLRALEAELAKESMSLAYFSPVLIESSNAWQIRKDIQFTMSIALLCIVGLLILVYRHWMAPVLFLIPALLGILFALAVITVTKHQLSAIAMGAAVVIFGIVLDYSFHFFTSYRRSGSLYKAVKEVADPLLTSCLTTVLAFALLLFTSSPVLQDFGLFAALSLIGAALSVLMVLPIFLALETKPGIIRYSFEWSGWRRGRWYVIGGVVVITVFFLGKISDAGFDANLYNLNYYPDWLQRSEELFTGIDPDRERRLLFSVDSETSIDEVKQILDTHLKQGHAKGYFLREVFDPSLEAMSVRNTEWKNFWTNQKGVVDSLVASATARGFRPEAFDGFEEWIQNGSTIEEAQLPPSYVIVSVDQLAAVSAELSAVEDVEVVDLGAGWQSLITDLKDNFNLILIGTSLLIFLILLIVYGRIELTLITFLPMALSWIWIVGATVLLGIEFNFISIVLATFIFGLGDDFAIFITNAHLERYKASRGDLTSNRVAIFLSATTTLIGMAALLGAQHPALRSLSGLSILGIITILVVSLIVQPILIRMLITDNTRKGFAPMTLVELFFSLYSFGFFMVVSVLATVVQLILRLSPGSRRKKSRFLRVLICYSCRFLLKSCLAIHLKKYNTENLDFSNPSIIVANHSSFVDILQIVSLSPDLVILTKRWVYHSPLFGPAVRYAGYLYVDHGFDENESRINQLVEDGCSIMIFPEGTRSPEGEYKRWQKGALFMSESYKLDITPVVLHGYGGLVPKGSLTMRTGIASVVALPRIAYNDETYGVGYRDRTKAISKMFRAAYDDFAREHATTNYHFYPILSTFIYKGPVIEWYFRIKWMLEKANYRRIDELLPKKGNIYDLGCGLGYIALYLHRRSKEREVLAIDYDDEKVAIAMSHYLNGSNLQFRKEDIREFVPENADGILLGDVLHYLNANDQSQVLSRCARNLNPGGTLVIRDGMRGDNEKHKKTIQSERWSTRIYKFNKTDDDLHFFNLNYLKSFAQTEGLEFEQVWESDSTSNALCVLKKPNVASV